MNIRVYTIFSMSSRKEIETLEVDEVDYVE